MTPELWIALLSGFASAAAAAGTLLTVREMDAQRKATYRPNLMFERVNAYCNEPNENVVATWTAPAALSINDDKSTVHFKGIPLLNVGFGTAKHLELQWRSSLEDEIKTLQGALSAADGTTTLHAEAKFLTLSRNGTTYTVKRDQSGYVDHILPVSVSAEKTHNSLPTAYTLVIAEMIRMSFRDTQRRDALMTLPKIELAIRYADISGRFHKTKFDIHPHLSVAIMGDKALIAFEATELLEAPPSLKPAPNKLIP